MIEILNNIIVNIAILMILGNILPRIAYVREKLFNHHMSYFDKIVFSILFGIIGILATYTGISVNGAIVNTRVIGVITGGILGGPVVGLFAGIIAGFHRIAFDFGGFTSLSCGISTIVAGLIGGMMYMRIRNSRHQNMLIFATTFVAEVVQMALIVLIAQPQAAAIELVQIIGIPMILLNSFGIIIFMESMFSVSRSLDAQSAKKFKLAFDITEASTFYLRKGFDNQESIEMVANIIEQKADAQAVFVSSLTDIIASSKRSHRLGEQTTINFLTHISEVIKTKKAKLLTAKETKQLQVKIDDLRCHIAPIIRQQVVIGTIIFFDKFYKEGVESNLEFVQGLANFLSSQLELSEIENQRKLVQKAELQALHSQVNPHFLFNALNTISAYSRQSPDRARELLLALASYFRNTLSRHEEQVSIHAELEHVHSYIEIEKARYEEKLQINLDYNPNLQLKVPYFIIQPLVENSIKHGMKNSGLTIDLKISLEKSNVKITVKDNGKGMEKAVINALLTGNHDKNKIGLANIHNRLKSIYPNNQGLNIQSEIGVNTTISMLIPLKGVSR